jgi:PPK2 family polyphosphate:nucleotide phosphotransferase
MDASGKDSAIDHVLSGINPQGITVTSFKHPSAEELAHDFLWRAAQNLPRRGRIGVFNRSHYEEVLIVRVHPEILEAEAIPDLPEGDALWKDRYRSILDFESHLCRNGTRIVKFFLHLSKEEQRERFLARLEEPEKNWKFNAGDLTERKLWKRYEAAYEDMLAATSTKQAPWYVVPADRKSDTRLIIAEVLLETMKGLKLTYPKVPAEQRNKLAALERRLKRNAD